MWVLTLAKALDSLLRIFQVPLRQVHILLSDPQIGVPHQLCDGKHIDASLDSACAVRVSQVVESEGRFDGTISQRALMGRLELRHRPAPIVAIADSSRKDTFTFCVRKAPLEYGKHSGCDRHVANRSVGLPFPHMDICCRRFEMDILTPKLKNLAWPEAHLDHDCCHVAKNGCRRL